jgi:hypothetical protein
MDLVLHWNAVVEYFGDGVSPHEHLLSTAGNATHALLACKWAAGDPPAFANAHGDHAEERVLASSVWTGQVVQAIDSWTDLDRNPIIVMLMINRSPCGHCAHALAEALHRLEARFPRRVERQQFIVASRGYYQGAGFMKNGKSDRSTVTTGTGLRELAAAGWKQCVLQFGDKLPARGHELLQFLRRMPA